MSAADTVTLRIRAPRSERHFIHWVLEAHEGLATLTEPGDAQGELVLTVPRARLAELEALLEGLAREVPLTRSGPLS